MLVRSTRLFIPVIAAFGLVTTLAPRPARAQAPERIVTVRCDNGASLQRRIDNFADEAAAGRRRFVFEIHGFCAERVEIRYPLTLRGLDPSSSGITGPADLEGQVGLVQVLGVLGAPAAPPRTVQIDNLTIKDSPQTGLLIVNSEVGLDDVVIRNNFQDGLSVTSAGFVIANRATISDNRLNGINSRVSSRVFCSDCVMDGNGVTTGAAAVTTSVGGLASLSNPAISGVNGLRTNGGEIIQNGGTVAATGKSAFITRGHLTYQNNAQVSGDVWCEIGATVTMSGANNSTAFTQTATSPTGYNSFATSCTVSVLLVNATFVGTTQITHRAHLGVVPTGSATLDTLNCYTGGTAAAGNTAPFVVGGIAGVPVACNP